MPTSTDHTVQIQRRTQVAKKSGKLSQGGIKSWINLQVLRVAVTIPVIISVTIISYGLYQTGYFAPLGSRIRGLFVKHTRTGNPLVDSVAEHQPASTQAYQQYLHKVYDLVLPGLVLLTALRFFRDSATFIITYAFVAYYFSSKMARLIVLLGPVSSVLGGTLLGYAFDHGVIYPVENMLTFLGGFIGEGAADADEASDDEPAQSESENQDEKPAKKGKGNKKKGKKGNKDNKEETEEPAAPAQSPFNLVAKFNTLKTKVLNLYNFPPTLVVRVTLLYYLFTAYKVQDEYKSFYDTSHSFARSMSQPQIMFKANLRNGKTIIVDDYREAYWWLRDNTPEDARVMAWWDYGYQITGIGERTSIADGNTWNHEHIATLGKILSSNVKNAHRMARHLADYVLVWAGGGGDDLAKSPHMARIGNSVYNTICPKDPTCSKFGFFQGGIPMPMMRESLLYKMTQHGLRKGVTIDQNRFRFAFQSKYGKVRIFKVMHVSQDSKKWVADPKNRVCDAPGSWYCVGQYPPKFRKYMKGARSFSQLEDFNKKSSKKDKEYQKQYMKKMAKLTGKGIEDIDDDSDDPEDTAFESDMAEDEEERTPLALQKVGCFYGENYFSDDKKYGGGASGAQASLALDYADDSNKKFVAISRAGNDGHSFAFDSFKPGFEKIQINDQGCKMPCIDDQRYQCGCADALCGGLGKQGEEHLRRWVVYKVLDDVPESKKPKSAPKKRVKPEKKAKKPKKSKKRGKKGRKRTKKSEL